MRTFRQKLLLICICSFFVHQVQGQIIYVDAKSTNMTQDGNSWGTAFTSLEAALVAATAGDEIRVAGDQTHKPSTSRECPGCTISRDYYFLLNTNITLKGSYTANTSNPEERDYSKPTLLSGDIGIEGNDTDNTYHVLVTRNLTAATEIDGFTITQGNANGAGTNTIDGVTVSKAAGGGMFSYDSSPKIHRTVFTANQGSFGAGMYNTNIASPEISNTMFIGNIATNFGGAMLNTFASAPKIINTLFTANQASQGAGMYNINGMPEIINATFFGNTATVSAGGIYNSISTLTMYNTVLYNNTNNDIVEDGSSTITSSHNFSENYAGTGFTPLTWNPFVNSSDPDGNDNTFGTADDGLVPGVGSVLIDAGDNNRNNTTTDIAGQTRKLDGNADTNVTIDVGAYEYKATLTLAIKAFLSGPYDTNTNLMRADLGSALLPTNTPYTDGATANSSVFDVTGTNAIVDWVFVELRNKNDITTVLHSSSALLQRDGDVVAMDGTSVLAITATADDYYISISHRNHIAIATDATYSLNGTATTIDFTNVNNIRGGATAVSQVNGVYVLIPGDTDGNGQVQLADYIAGLGLVGQAAYTTADINMDGQVQLTDILNILVGFVGKGISF